VSHDDGACEESDDSWQSHELAKKIGEISVEKNETGLFDGMFVDGLIHFEQITQSKATECSKSYTEEK